MNQLGNADLVQSMTRKDHVLVSIGGRVKRIMLDNLANAINIAGSEMLRQTAWGVPVKQSTQSNTDWGRIGNLTAWQEYKRRSGRFLVTADGRAAKLNPSSSTIYADGTPLDETKGNIMVIAPRLYFRVEEDSVLGLTLWMSELPIGGYYIGNTGYNVMGSYLGTMDGSKLVSRRGSPPKGAMAIDAFWNAAQVNGSSWGLVDYDLRKLMIMIALSEYGNTNIQEMLGYGMGGSGGSTWDEAILKPTGETAHLGDHFGTALSGLEIGTDTCHVSLMGIEDPYSWLWENVQGIYFGSSDNVTQTGAEVFLYSGNRMPSAAELADKPQGDYRVLERIPSASSSYIKEMIIGPQFDIIPTVITGGGSTSYWADGYWSAPTGQLARWGGHASYGSLLGLSALSASHAWSLSSASHGSRLAYYGDLRFVNGREIN